MVELVINGDVHVCGSLHAIENQGLLVARGDEFSITVSRVHWVVDVLIVAIRLFLHRLQSV